MQTKWTPLKDTPTQIHSCFGGAGVEGVEVLASLGLSSRQARVYLGLLKTGNAKAKTVAEYAQVERQEVYGIIEDLKLAGLVEQNLTVPISYTATPIAEAMKLLLEQKTDQLITITKTATQLAKKLNQPQNLNQTSTQLSFGSICDGCRGKNT